MAPVMQKNFCLLKPIVTVIPGHIHCQVYIYDKHYICGMATITCPSDNQSGRGEFL